jgi:CSLREA domain-containing protein
VTTFNVDSTLDEPDASAGDNLCLSTPSGGCTLRAAIQQSNAMGGPNTINLSSATYQLTIGGAGEDAAATGDLDITDSVSIVGLSPSATVIDGGGLDRVFHIFGAITVQINDVTLQNGDAASGFGGGLLNDSGSNLTLTTVVVAGNNAFDGGGLANLGGGALNLSDVEISANSVNDPSAAQGGGLYNSGTATLDSVTIGAGNTATSGTAQGGGLWNSGTITLTNVTLSTNQANGAIGEGGGLYNSGSASLTSVTLYGNSASTGGGNLQHAGGLTRLFMTLVAAGSPNDCSGGVTSNNFNLESPGNTCGFGQPNDLVGVSAANLNIGPLAANGGATQTHALLDSPTASVAIDAGTNAGCPAVDQRGNVRPVDGPDGDVTATCDIGAFEYP